jgi:subtilisin family serine protease
MGAGGGPFGSEPIRAHGTSCAGIAAAVFNNSLGISGIAGNCRIMPISFHAWTDSEVAAGINYAADNGAKVISMSFGQYLIREKPIGWLGSWPSGWDFSIIDPAVSHAVNDIGCVLCAATGNEDLNTFNRYPSRHPLVIACGASDQIDNRKSPTSPDGEGWGSNYANGVSVVAPGVLIPTTDIQGASGWNTSPGVAGNYTTGFNGTSSATPHVSGLAGLLLVRYPSSSNNEVRQIIEQTAEKVGVVPYSEMAGYANGTRNQEMGYGRINVYHSLDYSNIMIKDWPGDTGTEPSTPPGGVFWDFSDLVVRITDDNVFIPEDPSQASNVERGQTNYIYVRVTNNGPQEARNVVVSVRITPFVGTEFIYPTDWQTVDPIHVSPTPISNTFVAIAAGGSEKAKFSISSEQVETLWGWKHDMGWHPCLLASTSADNDYAFTSASGSGIHTLRLNNLAQRNLSVINVLAGASVLFPFISGHRENSETTMELVINRTYIPKNAQLLLSLDDDGSIFPMVDFASYTPDKDDRQYQGTIFLERTKMKTILGCCEGILTLEKGSRFDCFDSRKIKNINVNGGKVLLDDGKRFVEIVDSITSIKFEKQPKSLYPMSLRLTIPTNTEKENQYRISITQKNKKEEPVGGATVIYSIR